MLIDGLRFTEIPSGNKSVVTFQRSAFENLKLIVDTFEVGVIHDISFDNESEDVVHKMYTDPMTFSKNKEGYTLSFILTDVPQADIDARDFNNVKPLVKECLKFAKGQRISYEGIPYIAAVTHTAVKGKSPDKEPLLYENMLQPRKVEPWDEKKTYNKGDLVTARNLVFISQLDNNKGNEPGFTNAWNYYKN